MPLNTTWIDLSKPWVVSSACWHHENLPLIPCAAVMEPDFILSLVSSVLNYLYLHLYFFILLHWEMISCNSVQIPVPQASACHTASSCSSQVFALQRVKLLFQIPKTWTGSRACVRGRLEVSAKMTAAACPWWGKSLSTHHFRSPLCVGHQDCGIWEVKLGSPARCHCRLEHTGVPSQCHCRLEHTCW